MAPLYEQDPICFAKKGSEMDLKPEKNMDDS
jgi:hypothetical protein